MSVKHSEKAPRPQIKPIEPFYEGVLPRGIGCRKIYSKAVQSRQRALRGIQAAKIENIRIISLQVASCMSEGTLNEVYSSPNKLIQPYLSPSALMCKTFRGFLLYLFEVMDKEFLAGYGIEQRHWTVGVGLSKYSFRVFTKQNRVALRFIVTNEDGLPYQVEIMLPCTIILRGKYTLDTMPSESLEQVVLDTVYSYMVNDMRKDMLLIQERVTV